MYQRKIIHKVLKIFNQYNIKPGQWRPSQGEGVFAQENEVLKIFNLYNIKPGQQHQSQWDRRVFAQRI